MMPPPDADAGPQADAAMTGDGGTGDAGVTPGYGRVVVTIEAKPDDEPVEGAMLTHATMVLREARARNDRGGEFEPRLFGLGLVDLRDHPEFVFENAPPATYARITISSETEPGSIELRFEEASRELRIVVDEHLNMDARCERGGGVLAPESTLHLELELKLEKIIQPLRDLDLPSTGLVTIDRSTPEAYAIVRDALHREAWTCEAER